MNNSSERQTKNFVEIFDVLDGIDESVIDRLKARKQKYIQWMKNLSGEKIEDVDEVQFIFLFKNFAKKINDLLSDISKDRIRFYRDINKNEEYKIIFDNLYRLYSLSKSFLPDINEAIRPLSMLKALASGKIDPLIWSYLKEIKKKFDNFEEDLKKLDIDRNKIVEKIKNKKIDEILKIVSFLIEKYNSRESNNKDAGESKNKDVSMTKQPPVVKPLQTVLQKATLKKLEENTVKNPLKYSSHDAISQKSLVNLANTFISILNKISHDVNEDRIYEKFIKTHRRLGYSGYTIFPLNPKVTFEDENGNKHLIILRHVINKDRGHSIQYRIIYKGGREKWEDLLTFYPSDFIDENFDTVDHVDIMKLLERTSHENYKIISRALKLIGMDPLPKNITKPVSDAFKKIIIQFGRSIQRGKREISKAEKEEGI